MQAGGVFLWLFGMWNDGRNENGRTKPHIERLLLEMCPRFLRLLFPM